jgi:glycine betaine/proline transport system ATP-binding protein
LLKVEGLWKVFGSGSPDRAIDMARSGATRAEIRAATGHTVGVKDVGFEVVAGETFVVMGLSGSGKSTLIRSIARLNEPTLGSVLLDGEDLTQMSADALREVRRKKMAMVFQHFGLFPHRRVIDNAAYGLEVRGVDKATRREVAAGVLDTVGLGEWAECYPQQLSGGMQQRVGLARALVVDPSLLFFDEPFSALDPLIRKEMQDELIRLQRQEHRTVVFITHDFTEAIRLGDRIAIMKDGVFEQVGTAEELVARPATEYVRAFTVDVPKSKVLTAAFVSKPLDPGAPEPSESRRVGSDTLVGSVLPLLMESTEEIGVVGPDGASMGVVDRAAVATLLGDEGR